MKNFYQESETIIPFLVHYPDHIQAMVNKLRVGIKESFPYLSEKIYLGWKAVGYTHPQAGYVGAIFPMANQVMMALEHGAFLPDEKHQLVFGKSPGKKNQEKQVKYLPIHRIDAAVLKNLNKFMEQAIAYQLLKRSIA